MSTHALSEAERHVQEHGGVSVGARVTLKTEVAERYLGRGLGRAFVDGLRGPANVTEIVVSEKYGWSCVTLVHGDGRVTTQAAEDLDVATPLPTGGAK